MTNTSIYIQNIYIIYLVDTDQIDVDYILNKGRILYYYCLASSKFTKTKYGLCFLLKDNFGTFHMVTFIKLNKVKEILIHNCDYFFYSDLSLIETPERDHYFSAIEAISEEAIEYLLPNLLRKDWKNHSNQTPFISIAAFLHHITSISTNIFMIKRLSSLENIVCGFIDNKGNNFIHAACELKQNIELTKVIIDNAMNQNHLLINVANFENQTPLRLCMERINLPRGDYSITSVLVEYLIKKGATLIIQRNESESMVVMNQFFIDCFQAKEEKSELIIAYELPQKGFQNSTYIYSKLNELNQCQIVRTNKLQKKPDVLVNMLKEQFDIILQTNCLEIIGYIFNSRNALLTKVDIATDNGDRMVHLAVRYANPTIFRYFLTEYEDWRFTNVFGDNVLHTAIDYRNLANLKVLVDSIPKQELNQLLFTPNKSKIIPSNTIMEKCEAFESLVIATRKGCSNKQGNNFLHIAVENLNFECLKFLVLNTPVLFFSSKNSIGCTPLQFAIIHQFIPAVELLLEHSSISMDSQDKFGFNLFHNSIIYYNEVIFKMVLSAVKKHDAKHPMNNLINTCTHPNPFTVSLTPYLLSIRLKRLDVTELLISNGAKIGIKDVDPPSLLKITKEFSSLERLFTLKLDGRNMTGLINPTDIQDLEFNRNHLLEHFYFKGEFNDFRKCFRDLSFSNIFKQNTDFDTILHLAIKNPCEKKTEFLLNEISDLVQSDRRAIEQFINAINGKGETALYLAVKNCYHAFAKRILDIGASIEILYGNGDNILHVSIRLGKQAMINVLLAQPEITKLFCKLNKEGKTPVQMLIHNGFINQSLTVIERVSGDVEIHSLTINGRHILEYFYLNGKSEHFQRCFQILPITKIIEQNNELNTILHLAIVNPFEEKLNFLLDQISDLAQSDERALQLINAINEKGETALYLAVKNCCHALTILILDIGADIETLYANKYNILHVSIHFADQAMINILLTRPKFTNLFCRPNEDGNSPIHLLIRSGYINEALVAIERISPENLLGDDGRLLLMLAIELDNQRIQNTIFNHLPIEFLLKVDNIKKNILHNAITCQNIFSIKRLIQHKVDITISDSSGKTTLHFAIDLRNDQIWGIIFEYLTTFNEHTQHQIIDIPNSNHLNLFQYSIIQNYFPAVRDLLKLRPNLFITDHENENTIIHLATRFLDCVPILKHLLNQINREDVDALLQLTNSLDLPPLHYAVHCENTEALKLFQQFNLNIAVPFEGNFVFFNKLFTDKLVLCKHLQTPPNSTRKPFLYGYKVNSPKETIFILTDIPHLIQCQLYQQTEVEIVHIVNEEDLSIFLQVPSTELFQILISKQVINLENSFSNESTLLHQAARHSNCSIVNYFFKYKGCDKRLVRHMNIFALDSIGNSILYYAMQNSNEQNIFEFLASILTNILERLVTNPHHPNILNKENANSKRILEVCFDLNKFDAFKCMLDPSFQMELTYEDSDGCTLLHKIVKGRGDERFLEALLDEIKRRILQESFAKYLNHPTRDLQQTVLHLCILKNITTLLNLISKYSPNFSCKDKDGNTPLHLATKLKSNHEHSATNALIQSLIVCILNLEGDAIPLLNAANYSCLTPIHFSIMNGNIHISNLLLSKGVNLYAIDKNRKSVLHYAIENENKGESEKVIKFLLDYQQINPNPCNDLLHM